MLSARAQVLYGNLLGTVTDSSGAVVPGAEIVATQIETGVALHATSNGEGEFRIGNVLAGNYDVSVKKDGFNSFLQRRIVVAFNTDVRVNAALQVAREPRW